jgi:hypothetical protein
MAQAGFTPIKLYYSTTSTATPLAANLALGELALNAYDGILYYKNSNTGLVAQVSSGGGSYTLNGVAYATSTTALGTNGNFTYNGTTVTTANDASISGLTVGKGANNDDGTTVVGKGASTYSGSGGSNTAIGRSTLSINQSDSNTACGYYALRSNVGGTRNTAVGTQAQEFIIGGSDNTSVGYKALTAVSGSGAGQQNTAVGGSALRVQTSSYGTAVGYQSLLASAGQKNTALGYQSGLVLSSGQYNTFLGGEAGKAATTGSGNVVIGGYTSAGTVAPALNVVAQSDQISIGSTSTLAATIQVAWTVLSDARDKINVEPVPHGLSFVAGMNPVKYQLTETRGDTEPHGPVRYGFLAQEVLALEGETPVIINNEDPDKLRYTDSYLLPVLVQAIKELKAEFDAYKASHP